jgi:hypothetical protein
MPFAEPRLPLSHGPVRALQGRIPQGPPPTGSGRGRPRAAAAMFDDDTDPIPLEELVIYEGDELIFDGSDPDRYTISLEDWTRELGGATDGHTVSSDADPGL